MTAPLVECEACARLEALLAEAVRGNNLILIKVRTIRLVEHQRHNCANRAYYTTNVGIEYAGQWPGGRAAYVVHKSEGEG